jgi:site-specific DNA-methyltransferase (adenine-specific)
MRPGAFLVAFGGTRTHHRVWCAIEDAGFVIQDTIAWMFGSGFPKRRDMLKPAFEPICLAYKPGGQRTMQVEEGRIFAGTEHMRGAVKGTDNGALANIRGRKDFVATDSPLGRWPANVCHDGSDEVMEAFDAAGIRSSGKEVTRNTTGTGHQGNVYGAESRPSGLVTEWYGDSGSAARFFFSAKAGAEDRWGSRHPTVKPVDLIAWLVALVTPPGGLFLDPFAGSGTAAVAALRTGRNAILIEREDQYVADIRERIAFYEGDGRHSLASKARRAAERPLGGLFDHRPYDEAADARDSYDEAVRAIGERVKTGEPVPDFFLPSIKL